MTSPFTVISFYTPQYRKEVERLLASLEAFSIPHKIVSLPDQGEWVRNCGMKPTFIAQQLAELDSPIVWLDADAEVVASPTLFSTTASDFMVLHRPHGPTEFASGTLYFSPKAADFIDRWCEYQDQSPRVWDQITLYEAYMTYRKPLIKTEFLPHTYNCKFDEQDKCPAPPVILHHQASRRLKHVRA